MANWAILAKTTGQGRILIKGLSSQHALEGAEKGMAKSEAAVVRCQNRSFAVSCKKRMSLRELRACRAQSLAQLPTVASVKSIAAL